MSFDLFRFVDASVTHAPFAPRKQWTEHHLARAPRPTLAP